MKLIIDGTEYVLPEIEQPEKYQEASASRMIMFCKRPGAKNYYLVSDEIAEKLLTAQSVTMKYRTQSSDEKDKSWNNGMIKKVKEIIQASFDDNTKYKHG